MLPQYNLDPNNSGGGTPASQTLAVPQWTPWAQGQMIMNFSSTTFAMIPDNFRQQSFEFLVGNAAALRF